MVPIEAISTLPSQPCISLTYMEVGAQNSKNSDLGAKDKEIVLPLAGLWVKKKLTKGGTLYPYPQHPSES